MALKAWDGYGAVAAAMGAPSWGGLDTRSRRGGRIGEANRGEDALKAWEGMRGGIAAMGGPRWGGVDTR